MFTKRAPPHPKTDSAAEATLVSLNRAGPFTKLADATTLNKLAIDAALRVVSNNAIA